MQGLPGWNMHDIPCARIFRLLGLAVTDAEAAESPYFHSPTLY